MKFSCLQKNLKKGLGMVGHSTGKKVDLPILNNILVEAKEGNIKLVATDLEIGTTQMIRGKVEEEGSCAIDAKTLINYISLLPGEKVEIKEKGGKVEIISDKYQTKINSQAGEEFPLIPEVKRDKKIILSVNELKQALTQTYFAAASNENRMELSGVLFYFKDNSLFLVATDSYRLAERKVKIEAVDLMGDKEKIIIPNKTISELLKILNNLDDENDSEDTEKIEIFITETQILFKIGSTEMVSRLIEGHFPDYEQIIPTQIKLKLTLNRAELIRGVKAVSLFSKNDINDIKLEASNGKLKMFSANQEGESSVELDGDFQGEMNELSLNYRYLIDGLNNINSDKVLLEVVDGNAPCILRPAGGTDYVYIIMPIRQ